MMGMAFDHIQSRPLSTKFMPYPLQLKIGVGQVGQDFGPAHDPERARPHTKPACNGPCCTENLRMGPSPTSTCTVPWRFLVVICLKIWPMALCPTHDSRLLAHSGPDFFLLCWPHSQPCPYFIYGFVQSQKPNWIKLTRNPGIPEIEQWKTQNQFRRENEKSGRSKRFRALKWTHFQNSNQSWKHFENGATNP